MFEMLGNFSLGDYYKDEAIAMAYEFVSKVLQIPNSHLRVSVHEKDDTARSIWKSVLFFFLLSNSRSLDFKTAKS